MRLPLTRDWHLGRGQSGWEGSAKNRQADRGNCTLSLNRLAGRAGTEVRIGCVSWLSRDLGGNYTLATEPCRTVLLPSVQLMLSFTPLLGSTTSHWAKSLWISILATEVKSLPTQQLTHSEKGVEEMQ